MKKNLLRLTYWVFLTLLIPQWTYAQSITITGKVTDPSGQAIPGVSVAQKGTTTGTTTGLDGSFSLGVSGQDAVLIFTAIGYASVEQAVGTSTSFDISLQEDVLNLEEVVISGLASTTKRGNLASAVETVSASQISEITVPQTVDGAFYGKFKGVNIVSNSGAPGGGISVKLRGVSSLLGSSQPLYIIDGIYVDNSAIAANLNFVSGAAAGGNASNQDNPSNRIADLSPEDIESIEVLKGASASSIYGSRAASGVIIITTKKGAPGKTSVRFDQSIGFTSIINPLGTRNWNEQRILDFYGDDAGPEQVTLFNAARNAGQLRDYEDELYGNTGFLSNSVLSVSGGSDKTRFYVSAIRKDEEGIVKRTGYEKTALRVNLTHEITKNIELITTSNFISSSTDRGYFNNDNTGTTMAIALSSTPPWAQLFPDENGNYPNNPYAASNFLQTRDLITNNEKVNRLIAGATLNITIVENETHSLLLTGTAGIDYYSLETRAIFPRDLQFQKDGNGTNGASIQGNTVLSNRNYQTFLVHKYSPNSAWTFTSQAGLLYLDFNRDTKIAVATQLIGSQTNLNQAGAFQIQQVRTPEEDFGFFIQEEINWDDKIILTGGLRADKSSNNGDPNKLFYYPKANIAINLHNFGFWSLAPAVSQFKLRFAYGQAGKFAAFGAIYSPLDNVLIGRGSGLLAGSLVNITRGNATIGPERQSEIETGFDLAFLNGRLGFNFTYYNKNVTDLLLQANVPTSSGFTSQITNAAELKNEGVEIGLDAQIIKNTKFTWNATLNFWLNRSEVTKLDVPAFNVGAFGATLGTFRIEEGKSVTQIVGIDPGADPNTGIKVLGDAEPDFQLSLLNNLTYRNFELSFIWHWKRGYENVNLSTLLTDLGGTSPDYDNVTLDPAKQQVNGEYRVSQLGASASVFVEDASYLRLRELGFYYNIPEKAFSKFAAGFVKGIRVGFSGYNLINIFDYNSYDPEVSNFGGGGLSTGIEVTPFPSAKRYYFHFSIKI